MAYWITDPEHPWRSKRVMGDPPKDGEKKKGPKGPYIIKGFSKFDPDSKIGEPTRWV